MRAKCHTLEYHLLIPKIIFNLLQYTCDIILLHVQYKSLSIMFQQTLILEQFQIHSIIEQGIREFPYATFSISILHQCGICIITSETALTHYVQQKCMFCSVFCVLCVFIPFLFKNRTFFTLGMSDISSQFYSSYIQPSQYSM